MMRREKKRSRSLAKIFFTVSFCFLTFLLLKVFFTKQYVEQEHSHQKLSEQLQKEKEMYWDLKSQFDKAIDEKIADENVKKNFRRISKDKIPRVVFKAE